jgi:hypothetical protein
MRNACLKTNLNKLHREAKAPIYNNNFNIASTWKAASAHPESRNTQQAPQPKPEKQPKTQKANPESRNFHAAKSRNLKISKHQQQKKAKSHNITD